MKKINEEKALQLIEDIKIGKSQGKGLVKIFKEFSIKNDMAMGSVRNYYYKTLKTCKKNNKLKEMLNINDDMFPLFIKEFSLAEERHLLKEILIKISNGKSVRKSINELSFGKEKLLLRNQNKYRNILKNKPNLVKEVCEEITKEFGYCKNPYNVEIKETKINQVKSSINKLINKIFESIVLENKVLKEKISLLESQNVKLKEILKKSIKDKNLTKEFFLSGKEKIVDIK